MGYVFILVSYLDHWNNYLPIHIQYPPNWSNTAVNVDFERLSAWPELITFPVFVDFVEHTVVYNNDTDIGSVTVTVLIDDIDDSRNPHWHKIYRNYIPNTNTLILSVEDTYEWE